MASLEKAAPFPKVNGASASVAQLGVVSPATVAVVGASGAAGGASGAGAGGGVSP
jgi:hypothetical protein